MRCPSCGFDNVEGMKFCGRCATPLSGRCPRCGTENPPGYVFCGQCATPLTRAQPGTRRPGETGKRRKAAKPGGRSQHSGAASPPPLSYTPRHLAERIRAQQAALEARGVTAGERKTITALFADLKGSTALIEGLDPEEARALIDPALKIMMDAVHRYEGYVAQALGDGIFALFGAPLAHEDHAQRALYAALRMQDEMRRYADALRQGLTAQRATGTELQRTYCLALLAEAYGKTGQVEEGLTTVAEALAMADRTGERFYEAELYRLKGELTLQQSAVRSPRSEVPNTQHPTPSTYAEAEAEACFQKAIEIARRQQAKSLELRATTSLARLWQQQGKHHEARKMLSDVYRWFTEGFDTADLTEAKALLQALS